MSNDKHLRMMLHLSLFALLLTGCGGGGTRTDLDIFKEDIAAVDGPILLGTFNSQPVRIVHDDVYAESKTLYAYVNLGASVMSSRLAAYSGEYIVYYMEDNQGEYQNDGVNFTFESTIDYTAGTATDLSDITNVTGTSSTTQQDEAQAFVDFVASESKVFLDEVKSGEDETEASVVAKLENAGYTFNTYDQDSYDYFENQTNTKYDLNIEVVKLYQGYVNQSERFTQIVVFKNAEQATQVYYARSADTSEIGYYFRAKHVFVYTASLQTYQLLTQTNA